MRINRVGDKIDIGCGEATKEGFIGIDWVDHGQDIVWNVVEGLPLQDNSVAEIYSSHFVEHIDEQGINKLFNEIVRVCKVGANIRIKCPHADCPEAYYLSHLTRWNEDRVKGIVNGLNGYSKKQLRLVSIKREGIELQFELCVE